MSSESDMLITPKSTTPLPPQIDPHCGWNAQMQIMILNMIYKQSVSQWTRKIMDVLIPNFKEIYQHDANMMNAISNFLSDQTDATYEQVFKVCPPHVQNALRDIKLKQILPDVDPLEYYPWLRCTEKNS